MLHVKRCFAVYSSACMRLDLRMVAFAGQLTALCPVFRLYSYCESALGYQSFVYVLLPPPLTCLVYCCLCLPVADACASLSLPCTCTHACSCATYPFIYPFIFPSSTPSFLSNNGCALLLLMHCWAVEWCTVLGRSACLAPCAMHDSITSG